MFYRAELAAIHVLLMVMLAIQRRRFQVKLKKKKKITAIWTMLVIPAFVIFQVMFVDFHVAAK